MAAASLRARETSGGAGHSVARHIAKAAARLFASRGYDATSVREIVEAAGVTKPTLYYHYGSKEGLAQALVIDPLTRLREAIGAHLESSEVDPIGLISGLFEIHFEFCREDPDRTRFIYALFFGPLGSGLAEDLGRFGDRMDIQMLDAAGRLADLNAIAPDRVEDFASALRGLVVVRTVDSLYRDRPLGPDLARRLASDLLQGFGTTGQDCSIGKDQ